LVAVPKKELDQNALSTSGRRTIERVEIEGDFLADEVERLQVF
jgi:hypothetical protein